MPSMIWRKIPVKREEINLKYTLTGGQCFRWKNLKPEEWIGVFADHVWILHQHNEYIMYSVHKSNDRDERPNSKKHSNISDERCLNDLSYDKLLRDYLRLDFPLTDHYNKWASCDNNFKNAAEKFSGIRILNQDPVENIFSFICSSNNHISRISSMVEKLCKFYGNFVAEVDGTSFYSFPPIENLAHPNVESKLRKEGFGYRAKYISQSANKIMELGSHDWLKKLKTLSYREAKEELMQLSGIGAKVADCICLMSLGHLEAVPVDTHVFQIATKYYLPRLASAKTVTTKIYNEIGNHFQQLYGEYAGWAHTILFCADLKLFQNETDCVTAPKRKKKNV